MCGEIDFSKEYTMEDIERARNDFKLQEDIIKQFYPLIDKSAYNFQTNVALFDFDDRVQIGMLAIVESIRTYNGRSKFSTHVNNMIRYAFLNERNKQCSVKNFGVQDESGKSRPADVVSLYTEVYTGSKNNKSYSETIADMFEDKSLRSALDECIKKDGWNKIGSLINERERYCIEQVYIHERTMKELADEFGVTHQRVRQLLSTAYCKICRKYNTPDRLKSVMLVD